MMMSGAGLVLFLGVGAIIVRPAVEPAYPTSFFAPAEPYAAASVVHGARLYAENCALCHGADGRGDGPAAASLTVHPADLTAPHLFAHTEGDLFWWVSHGRAHGVMPGFAAVMSPAERWDVINFVHARAAGVLSGHIGPTVSTAATSAMPDFAFEAKGRQNTLDNVLKAGPALLALFGLPPSPRAWPSSRRHRSKSAAGCAFWRSTSPPSPPSQPGRLATPSSRRRWSPRR